MLRNDGRLVFINATQGGKFSFDASELMRRRLTITGSTLRIRDAAFKARLAEAVEEKVWPYLLDGSFKPVIFEIFPMKEAAKAHTLMESSEHIGKIVLVS